MNRLFLLLLTHVLVLPALAAPPVINNVRASQRPGTKLVDIYYDLSDSDGDLQLVQVAASSDSGLTYGLPCVTLSGAVGANVSQGSNRHIVWNAGADWDGNWVAQCRVRVTAHDGTTPPAPHGMVYIPPGPFQMGDNFNEVGADALPTHQVTVSYFFIDKTEVTKALWEQVQAWGNNNGYSIGGGSGVGNNHPVINVGWYDAVKWCNARSAKEGLTPCYYTDDAHSIVYKSGSLTLTNAKVKWDANGYRLPTEAEWEKAARGGRTGQRYPAGDEIDSSRANLSGHPVYNGATSPVGVFPSNGFGLFDMAGNVMERCWDAYAPNYYGQVENGVDPHGPLADNDAWSVMRGGACRNYTNGRIAARPRSPRRMANYVQRPEGGGSSGGDYAIGFRAVRR